MPPLTAEVVLPIQAERLSNLCSAPTTTSFGVVESRGPSRPEYFAQSGRLYARIALVPVASAYIAICFLIS